MPANQCFWPEVGVPGQGGCSMVQPAQQTLLPACQHGTLALVAVAFHLIARDDQLKLSPKPPLPKTSGFPRDESADAYANDKPKNNS